MELFANRFAVSGGRVVDLATGIETRLIVSAAGGAGEEARWLARCDRLQRLRHPALAPLVDFGRIGETQRFEAWASSRPWRGSGSEAAEAAARVSRLLARCGLTATQSLGGCVHARFETAGPRRARARPIVVPDPASGYEISGARARGDGAARGIDECGLAPVRLPAVDAVAELFTPPGPAHPLAVGLWGHERYSWALLTPLARAARVAGYVPLRTALALTPLAGLLAGRSCFIIATDAEAGWRALLDAVVRSPRPHVLLVISASAIGGVPGVHVGRVPELDRRPVVRLGDLALPPAAHFARPEAARLSRVAEQPAVYDAVGVARPAASAALQPWVNGGEVEGLRQRVGEAVALASRGRRARADRMLRQAAAALARREAWSDAWRPALALAEGALDRGRLRDAERFLTDARGYAARAHDDKAPADLIRVSCRFWLESGRLDEAEDAATAALAAARAAADCRLAAAALDMSRCLFWRGRYEDAERFAHLSAGAVPDAMEVHRSIAASRCAIGRRDPARGLAAALEAVARAAHAAQPDVVAHAHLAAAFARLAVGDADAVQHDVARCLLAARAAHRPLVAARARLLRAEADRRAGRPGRVAAVLARFGRRAASCLPPIVAARRDLLEALVRTSPRGVAAAVEECVRRTGLPALALFAPPLPSRASSVDPEEVVAILTACQATDDEARALGDVCARLRRRLDAAAVAMFAFDDARACRLAADGHRIDADIVERARAAEAPIAPHQIDGRVEGAVPVRYGGGTIGALAARWGLGTPPDPAVAVPLLTMAATAAAPLVAGALAALARPAAAGADEIVGVSQAAAELRAAIGRAAAAPFPVLVEGESGSGKELVARAIHRAGARGRRPFCTLNCAAIPDDLVETELFGHARGAFTGAAAERRGVFEEADGGTLFLDEIGELSPRAQAKVLRAIQEGEIRRVGETIARRVDVRLVSATNRCLRDEVAAGRFRLDLFYRLNVLSITVAPLRERTDDVAPLAERFWREATARIGSHATLGALTLAALARYQWPGNIRELQNVLAALAVRSPKRGVVLPIALPSVFHPQEAADTGASPLDRARRQFEQRFVRAALVRAGGRRGQAAADLGVTRQGLTKLMTRLGIEA